MAINKPILIRTSSNTTSRLTGRVVDLSNNTLIQSPTVPTSGNPAGGQSQPPAGFNGPVPDALTGKLPERATAGSVTSSNADRQAAVNDKLGLADKASVIDALLGRGGDQGNGGGHPLTDLMGSTPTNGLPGMDQGFGPSPDGATLAAIFGGGSIGSIGSAGDVAGSSEVATLTGASAAQGSTSATRAQGGGSRVMNPMAPFQGGSVSGPLGELAGTGIQSLADFDKSGLFSIEAKSAENAGVAAAKVAAGATFVETVTGGGTAAVIKETALAGRVFAVSQAGVTAAGAVAAVAGAFAAGVGAGTLLNEAATLGLSAYTGKENYTLGDLLFDVLHPDDDASAAKPAQGGGVSIPDPENQGSRGDFLTQTILEQVRVAQTGKPTSQGGGGDATPVDDGGLGGVVRDGFIAVNQSSVDGRNLFGQPVGSGGENISGGNKGLNGFGNSNGAGVTNPGPDGGTPQGDARFAEDPGSALGGRQTSPNLGGGRNAGGDNGGSSSQAEDLVLNGTTGADTLRGLGGNDTLRGLAGRDILDGGAGRDQLTGGTGADRFRFSAGSSFGLANADRITDFNRAHGDRIEISRQAFSLAAGTSVSFQSVNTDQSLNQALAGGSLFVHDQRDGSLLFNQNGSAAGFGNGGVFANLGAGSALQASDLALIA